MQRFVTPDYINLHDLLCSSGSLALLIEVPAFGVSNLSDSDESKHFQRNILPHLFPVQEVAKSLLCTSPEMNYDSMLKQNVMFACGNCESCILFESETNPDIYYLNSNKDSKDSGRTNNSSNSMQITVDQIRNMLNFVNLSSHFSKAKVIVIDRIEDCNLNATNALLKVLEEPPHDVKFILLTNNISKLLPTIISRCYRYRLSRSSLPSAAVSSDILLDTFTQAQKEHVIDTLTKPSFLNIVQLTNFLDGKTIKFSVFLNITLHWLADLVCVSYGLMPQNFTQYSESLKELNKRLSKDKLFFLQDQIAFYSRWENHPLNYKLQIEALLLQYQQIFL